MQRLKPRSYYVALREQYRPSDVRLIFIAESPPVSGKYFYDKLGTVTEPLFRAMMFDILHIQPETKYEGLMAFKDQGYLLVDATYSPVNTISSNSERDEVILADYPALVADLLEITPDRSTRIIIIKANVCRLLDVRLTQDKFNVLNNGLVIPFPSTGQQGNFKRVMGTLIDSL